MRIRSIASAINHSDLEIRAGRWPVRKAQPFPYIPGLEVVGEVAEIGSSVRRLHAGDRVITMMQGLGGVRAERPGGYADSVRVADAVARLPEDGDPLDMATRSSSAGGSKGGSCWSRTKRPTRCREVMGR